MAYGYDQITQDVCCHIQGQNSPGGTARGSDGAGAGEAARHSPEPDLWLEEAGSRQRGEPFRARRERFGGWREEHERETAKLYTKIGQLTVERDFLARRL